MSTWTYSASNEANLMKVKYAKLIEKQFNKANVLFARMRMNKNFVGSQIEKPIVQSIGGGVGSGSLPTANENKIAKATITSKKTYAVISIDRESMKASKTDEGSFVRFTKFPVKIAVESFNRNLERMLTRNDVAGAGALVSGNATNSNVTGAGTSGDPYVISLDVASTYFPAEFECVEIGDIVNVNTETTELEVTDMSVTVASGYATGTISVVGTSTRLAALAATNGFDAADSLYMQGSKDNEMVGVKGAISATSGTLHNISIGRRWKAYQKDASAAALSTDLLNDVIMNVKRQCGESPNIILTSYHQYIKLLNLLESAKTYNLPAKDKKFKGQISFSAIEYLSPDGAIPVLPSRFIDSDEIFCLNDKHIELNLRPEGLEWFDEDGTVFLRESSDSYEARYGGYGELFINPHFQGHLSNLAV
jgi:hypothetical protein